MTNFETRTEIRHIIFGLCSVISETKIPEVITKRIGEIGKEMSKLVLKVTMIRVDRLRKNEGLLAQAVVAAP